MPGIDQVLSTGSPLSREVSGREVMLTGSPRQPTATAQVDRIADSGDFEVVLEGAANTQTGVAQWHPIARFDHEQLEDADESNVSTLPISAHLMLRFRHVSGATCRVILVG